MTYKPPSIMQLYIVASQFLGDEAKLNDWKQQEMEYALKIVTDYIDQLIITQRGGL